MKCTGSRLYRPYPYLLRGTVKEVVPMYMTYEQTILLYMFIIALIGLILQIIDRNRKKK